MNHKTKKDRQVEAAARFIARSRRSNLEQEALLNSRLGRNKGAAKERFRLAGLVIGK